MLMQLPACCRYNLFGQLGDNTYSDRGTPAVVTGAYTNFKLVAAGDRHTCGVLATSNRLACWGQSSLCSRAALCCCLELPKLATPAVKLYCTARFSTLPLSTRKPSPSSHAGYGYNYQLGTGATIDLAQPALVSDGGTATYRSVACGFGHTCALRTDDSIVCFGLNADGQSGDATFKDVQTPTLVAGAFKRVVAGTSHSCALRTSDGHALCWGEHGVRLGQPWAWPASTCKRCGGAMHTLFGRNGTNSDGSQHCNLPHNRPVQQAPPPPPPAFPLSNTLQGPALFWGAALGPAALQILWR